MKQVHFSLQNYNSYGIKATCREAVFPENIDEIKHFLSDTSPFFIIGSGNNIILSKAHYDERFLIFNDCFKKFEIEQNQVLKAQAGSELKKISEFCAERGLSGFESFYDIPGSVAGAIVMNAGDANMEIKDILIQVTVLNKATLQIETKTTEELNLSYRNSLFQKNKDWVILEAWFQLKPSDEKSVRNHMHKIKESRWIKQPRTMPNAGSVFKRPKGFYAGKLIEDLGLKGYQIGDAAISEKHAGFIVNKGNATGQQIVELIYYIREKVSNKYGIELEIEQDII
ncbi:MAG: UDP-N-acetylmuramate dehydrogenase [Brumimicrobium sp.]